MSDLISRKAVIQDIEDLLESPYAHSQFGEVSKEVGFIVRKDMAGTIIDLCIKRAEDKNENIIINKSEIENVIAIRGDKYITFLDGYKIAVEKYTE